MGHTIGSCNDEYNKNRGEYENEMKILVEVNKTSGGYIPLLQPQKVQPTRTHGLSFVIISLFIKQQFGKEERVIEK